MFIGLWAAPTNKESPMTSSKRLARIAGFLYLLVGVFGGFAEGYVEPKVYVAGSAAASAGNVIANAGLLRLGIFADLMDATFFVFVALALYILLKHVHKSMARAMLVTVILAAGITCVSALFEFEALRVATGAVNLSTFGTDGFNAVVLLLLDAQHYGLLIGQIFFGLWLAPLGYLAYRSGWFPKALGVVLVAACASYLVDVLAAFLAPDLGKAVHGYLIILPAVAEPSMVLWLLIVGVKTAKPKTERIVAAA
jgi:uncharacterized protein DUF4386